MKFLRELKLREAVDLFVGGNASYDSPDIFNQMLDCLNDIIVDELKAEVRDSPCVGTDRSQGR